MEPESPSPSNTFRAAWLYLRLPAGSAMLKAGTGLSPAFLRLLEAVEAHKPVSFKALAAQFDHMDADDLELWLAELCGMGLIVPAASHAAVKPGTGTARPDILLLHKSTATRGAWRELLAGLPVQLHEAATLDEANAAYNSLLPAAVVLGPEGGDFNALTLIHVLKHPRASRITKVILVLDERSFSPKIKSAAARADDTLAPEDLASLPERVARHLSLPKAARIAAAPLRLLEENERESTADVCAGLEREHPRVAAVIAGQWGSAALDDLFDQLLFDDRGGADFSPQAAEDLLFLYRMHQELRPEDAWRAVTPLRGRRARVAALRATGRLRTLASTQRMTKLAG